MPLHQTSSWTWRAAVDPHLNLPRLDNSLDDLAQDFYPFRQLNDAPAGMTAHIIISARR